MSQSPFEFLAPISNCKPRFFSLDRYTFAPYMFATSIVLSSLPQSTIIISLSFWILDKSESNNGKLLASLIVGIIIEIFVEEFLHTGIGSLSKKYSSQSIDPDTLKAKSQKLEYEDEFINIDKGDNWILNSRTIKYLNQNQEEETQKYVFKDLCLLN